MPASSAAQAPEPPERRDLITRGNKKSNPLGTSLFVGLRALDPLLQYGILAQGIGAPLLRWLGLDVLPTSPASSTGIAFVDQLGLSPYRLVLLTMAAGSAIKQIFWILYTSEEEFPPAAAILVSIYNTLFNSINSLAFTSARFSASASPGEALLQAPLIVGSLLYFGGIVTEAVAELQRKWFKQDPNNRGKCYTGGLWSLARHVNYTGYSAWRGGYSVAAAGWTWGVLVASWLLGDFTQRAIPVLDSYCSKRYGEQWAEFKRKTPYKIIPGIW